MNQNFSEYSSDNIEKNVLETIKKDNISSKNE